MPSCCKMPQGSSKVGCLRVPTEPAARSARQGWIYGWQISPCRSLSASLARSRDRALPAGRSVWEQIMVSAQSNAVAPSGGMYTQANNPLAQLGTLDGVENAIKAAYARPARYGTLDGLLE